MNNLLKFFISLIPWDLYSYMMFTSLSIEIKFTIWGLLLAFLIVINRHFTSQYESITL
ncbi:protein of unknown function [Xenorhabdus bovienii]|uniref:Uncharacterized protein n=1 Tax=Xenorhabdus bovienii TaxID=40576 RepID=A0A0B6XB42_XENBV|nr:protein of unknown function [Xenorhabdus bovienii]